MFLDIIWIDGIYSYGIEHIGMFLIMTKCVSEINNEVTIHTHPLLKA